MGPCKSFNLNYVLSEENRRDIDIEEFPGPLRGLFQNQDEIKEAQALLRRVQDELRADPETNAFLVLNVNIDTDAVERWDLRVETYDTDAELVGTVRQFAGEIMYRERQGILDRMN